MLSGARQRSTTNHRFRWSVARTVTTQRQGTGRVPNRLDLKERAQSRDSWWGREIGFALRHINPLHSFSSSLFQRFLQLRTGSGEIERVDVRMSRKMRSQFADLSSQD